MSKKLIIISLALILAACGKDAGNENGPSSGQAETPSKTAQDVRIEKKVSTLNELRLNDGRKWKSSQAAEDGIRAMRRLLDGFEGGSKKDYDGLRHSLSKEFSNLLRTHGLKGERQQAFNHILTAIFDHIDQLMDEPTMESVDELEAILDQYDEYFTL